MSASERMAEMTAATELQRLRGQAVVSLFMTIVGAIGAVVLLANALVELGLSPAEPAVDPRLLPPPSPYTPFAPRPPDVRDAGDRESGLLGSLAGMLVMNPSSLLYPWVKLQP